MTAQLQPEPRTLAQAMEQAKRKAMARRCPACGELWLACRCPAEIVPLDAYPAHWAQRYASEGEAAPDRMGIRPDEIEARAAPQRAFLIGLAGYLAKGLKGAPGTVFEFGCGTGRLLQGWSEAGWATYGTDATPAAIGFAKAKGFDVEPWNGDRVALPDYWADVVYTYTVLQHVREELLPAIAVELKRLVANRGLLILTENMTTNLAPSKPWVFFRESAVYRDLFHGEELELIGTIHEKAKEQHSTLIFRRRP